MIEEYYGTTEENKLKEEIKYPLDILSTKLKGMKISRSINVKRPSPTDTPSSKDLLRRTNTSNSKGMPPRKPALKIAS